MTDWQTILRALGALLAVIALAWGVARLVRQRQFGGAPTRRLAVTEALALDPRRRLVLIRCDDREALLLTGGQEDRLIGWLQGPGSTP